MKKDVRKPKSTPSKEPGVPPRKAASVGYCNPPVEHQWQRGQSGNPDGPPKKKLTKKVLRDFVEDVLLGDQVTLKGPDGSSKRQVPKLHALLIELSNCSLKGDSRTAKLVLGLVEKLAVEEESETTRESAKEDVTILRRHGILLAAEPDAAAEDRTDDENDELEPQNDDGSAS